MYDHLELDVHCPEAPERFARRLATIVGPGRTALTRVDDADGVAVYPVGAAPTGPGTLTCTFAARHGVLDDAAVADLLRRLGGTVTWSSLRPVPAGAAALAA